MELRSRRVRSIRKWCRWSMPCRDASNNEWRKRRAQSVILAASCSWSSIAPVHRNHAIEIHRPDPLYAFRLTNPAD